MAELAVEPQLEGEDQEQLLAPVSEEPTETVVPGTEKFEEVRLLEVRQAMLPLVRVGFEDEPLVEDVTKQSRERALEVCFTPREKIKGRRVRETLFKNGRSLRGTLSPSTSFIAPQIRELYDQTHYGEIGRSMRYDYGGQLQECTVGVHDMEHIEKYLKDLNDFFESNVTIDDLTWSDKYGGFPITVCGHNRQLAAAYINVQENGHPDRGIGFEARIFKNPPFTNALTMQAVENNSKHPDMWIRAKRVAHLVKLRARDGDPITSAQAGRQFGMSSDTVNKCIRFDALPEAMKIEQKEDRIPFDGAFLCDRLLAIYAEQDAIEIVRYYGQARFSTEQIRNDIVNRERVSSLPPEVQVFIHTKGLSVKQVEQLARLQGAQINSELILEKAQWIHDAQPLLPEVEKAIDKLLDEHKEGARSLFHSDFGMAAEERDRMKAAYRRAGKKASQTKAIRGAANVVNQTQIALLNGYAADVVEDRLLTKEINNTMRELLDSVDEEGYDLETAQNLAALLSRLETPKDDEVGKIIAGFVKIVEIESAETTQTQLRKLKDLTDRVVPEKAVEQQSLGM